jgi:uncharacterized protein (TIGR00730 family)
MFENISIAVYCASSAKVSPIYLDGAKELGEIFAKEQIHCIYGAGHVGLMGALADAVLAGKGKITGIIPKFMIDRNWHHKSLENIIVTETMHERKAQLASLAYAAVALPGGCGTLEELLEIITWKQLGLFQRPIVIVNIKGYFNPLIEMLTKAVDEQFMRPEHAKLWEVVNSPQEVLDAIKNAPISNQNDFNFAVV